MSAAIGAVVKARRTALGLSQRALPGLDQTTLSKIESGTTADPSFSVAQKLSVALGVSLDELAGAPASAVRMIALRDIEADPLNPRTVDVANSVDAEFVESIKVHGLLQAITVREIAPDTEGFGKPIRVAMGGRRYAALVALHGPESGTLVPCKITDAAGEDLLLQQLVENVQRADMNAADLASAVGRLVAGGKDTQLLATSLKKGRRWVQEQASVHKWLTADGKDALRKGAITISQAVALAAEHDVEKQNNLMAHASLEGLNEDEIRAIIADRRAKDAEQSAAVREAEQPPLIADIPQEPTKYPTANEVGVFERPTKTLRWIHKRGHFSIELVQFGDHKWCTGYEHQWRIGSVNGGSSGGPASRKGGVHQTAAIAFLDAARQNYPEMVRRASYHPEDLPAMRELHAWIGATLQSLPDVTHRVHMDWEKNNPAPEKPKAKAAAAPKPTPKEPPLTRAAIVKVPAWAKPMALATFVILEGQRAHLVKGWADMAGLVFKLYEKEEPRTLRDLIARASWQDDTTGKPFDFGSVVYRITDKKAR